MSTTRTFTVLTRCLDEAPADRTTLVAWEVEADVSDAAAIARAMRTSAERFVQTSRCFDDAFDAAWREAQAVTGMAEAIVAGKHFRTDIVDEHARETTLFVI